MKFFIKKAIELKLWNSLDIQFANTLVDSIFKPHVYYNNQYIKKIALTIASAFLSANVRSGHTCLPLDYLSSQKIPEICYQQLTSETIQKIRNLSVSDWQELLFSLPAVGDGSHLSPLILENQYLYLHRIWENEHTVAQFLSYPQYHHDKKNFHKEKIIDIINILFPNNAEQNIDHKIATVLGIIHPRVFISGGPGTGKTSVISKIITGLLLYDNNLRIKITAPTGKAAAILTNSCQSILKNIIQFNKNNKKHTYQSILHATTLHSLLGTLETPWYKKINNFSKKLNLDLDVIIIDEASMIGLPIFSQLILSIPCSAKMILLGDHNQLYSIEPGSVFKDICRFAGSCYSLKQQQELLEIIGYTCSNHHNATIPSDCCNIIDSTCILKKNYRFSKSSGIGQLANAINLGNHDHAISILKSKKYTELSYFTIHTKKDYKNMIFHCITQYYDYFKIVKNYQKFSITKILEVFNNYRILCALNQGIFGITKLNYYIEQILNYKKIIKLNDSKNYIGRPIIILKNAPLLNLCNGDIGILLPDPHQNQLSAYFILSTNNIKIIQIHQLPKYETCFAMTVHKAQGSSFQHVAIILSNIHLPILTRELLYTAVTRAQKKIFLYTTNKALIHTINLTTQRYGRLYEKIKFYSSIIKNNH